jgi:hypothetical protein
MDFEGLVNARDLGGVPLGGGGTVRAGVLYRSETPELMTEADVGRALGELGLVRVVDLRGGGARPYPLGAGGRTQVIDFFHLAGGHELIDGSEHGFLPSLLARGGVAVGRFLELVVEVDGPTLVHCHTGKDRTGFVAAMVLALVGAGDDDIVADYSRSVPVYDTMLANLNAVGLGVPGSAPPYARSAPSPEGMRTMLGRLRQGWSSPRHYLLDQGVDRAVLDEVTTRLTAPRAGATRPT